MSTQPLDLFHYKVIENNTQKTLFLLHGTGGTEDDLFGIVEPFAQTHTIVGLRGNVQEQGMNRFFERKSGIVFDQDSIEIESQKLSEFIRGWIQKYNIKAEDITFVGYSNGANMILATLFYYPELIHKAAILHPMLPFQPEETLNLSGKKILASWGPQDSIIPPAMSNQLVQTLKKHSANLTVVETTDGHFITSDEVQALHTFINT